MGYGRRAELVDEVMQVFCTHCQQYRPVEEFNIRSPLLKLYQYYCKRCQAEIDHINNEKQREKRGGKKRINLVADNPDPARLSYCPRCKDWRPKEEFNYWSVEKGILQTYCRIHQHEALREHYVGHSERVLGRNRRDSRDRREIAREYVFEYLLAHPCVDCGNTNPVVLTFDHVSGTKTANLADLVTHGYSMQTIQTEMAKCEVVCHNCHAVRTQKKTNGYRWKRINGA
jgi:hypothetical protein